MRVSVVAAFHNELEFLPRFFEHLRQYADEVHVGVHSATDGSLEYAQKIQNLGYYDMTVQEFPSDTVYKHGFSYMKNELIAKCTGDWIVCLDADEEMEMSKDTLLPFTLQKNLAISTQTLHLDYTQPDWSMYDTEVVKRNAKWIHQRHWRIFRNGLGIKWYGLIHEELRLPTGRHVASMARQSNIKMYHYGALANLSKRGFKEGLYAELILRIVENPELRNGTSPWWWTTFYEENKEKLLADRAKYREGDRP